MLVHQFYLEGLAHMSYLVGDDATHSCAIVDPHRDVDVYLDAAHAQGYEITHIFETHTHSDFVSGARELAARTGAPIYLSAASERSYPHVPLNDGDTIRIGTVALHVVFAPGHTSDHVCLTIADTMRSVEPSVVLTGDALFVGDVGRPDLVEDSQRAHEMAVTLYHSLFDRLLQLPDYVEAYPGHGQGSLCGRHISSRRRTTIGFERRHNPALRQATPEEFADHILKGQPGQPPHWERIRALNRQGPQILGGFPSLDPLPPKEVATLVEHGHFVLDVREPHSFGGAHIPGALNIWLSPNLATWASWLVTGDRPLVLVADRHEEIADAVRWLMLVGFERFSGFLGGGMPAWHNEGLLSAHLPQISVPELRQRLEGKSKMILLDVRTQTEWVESRVENALHIPLNDLPRRLEEVPRDRAVATFCGSGRRANVAGSLLRRHGFEQVVNVLGSMTGWKSAGYPVTGDTAPEKGYVRLRVHRHNGQRGRVA